MPVQGRTAYEVAINEDVKCLLKPVTQQTGAQGEADWVTASVYSHRSAISNMQAERTSIQWDLASERAEKAKLQVCSSLLS